MTIMENVTEVYSTTKSYKHRHIRLMPGTIITIRNRYSSDLLDFERGIRYIILGIRYSQRKNDYILYCTNLNNLCSDSTLRITSKIKQLTKIQIRSIVGRLEIPLLLGGKFRKFLITEKRKLPYASFISYKTNQIKYL